MKFAITASALLITGAFIALPQAAFADKPADRTPQDKTCPFMWLSACADELGNAGPTSSYVLVENFLANNEVGQSFLSNNPERDAGTLLCKISGADIKLYEGKIAASDLLADAIAKILVLRDASKLSPGAWQALNDSFVISKACIDEELGL